MMSFTKNVRPNFVGDHPEIDPSALIDPSAQIIGNVKIGKNVIVGPLSVIRADEKGPDGKVHPIILDDDINIQDGVIIHNHGSVAVRIGARTSVAHGVVIHGPCTIGKECFLSMRATLYNASLEAGVWVGMGALIMRTDLPAGTMIRSILDTKGLRLVSENEKKYIEDVLASAKVLLKDYRKISHEGQFS